MGDSALIELYFARSENAIVETERQYGRYCRSIANRILDSRTDSEECVNDTWLKTWNTIPPQRPDRLAVFLGKITRHLALDRFRQNAAEKRGSGQVTLALDELQECLPASDRIEQIADALALRQALNRFLDTLSNETRIIFLQRYWYLYSVKEIADHLHISQSKVKMVLLRTRNALKAQLEKEGLGL